MRNFVGIGMVLLALWGLSSCQKTENSGDGNESNLENNLTSAVSEVVTNSLLAASQQDIHGIGLERFDGSGDVIKIPGMMHGMEGMGFRIPHMSDCATIIISDTTYPNVITIDYGNGCSDYHHHLISGKIVISQSDTLTMAGATRIAVSDNLMVDSVRINFSNTYKNLGKNDEGLWQILLESNETLVMVDGTVVKKTGSDTLTWTSGFLTANKLDDVFYKSGKGDQTINDSLTYSRTITKPLLFDRSCPFIKSGIVELVKSGDSVVIDYGDGSCDNLASVTTNGNTEEIHLNNGEFGVHGNFHKHCHEFGHGGYQNHHGH